MDIATAIEELQTQTQKVAEAIAALESLHPEGPLALINNRKERQEEHGNCGKRPASWEEIQIGSRAAMPWHLYEFSPRSQVVVFSRWVRIGDARSGRCVIAIQTGTRRSLMIGYLFTGDGYVEYCELDHEKRPSVV